MKKYFSKHLSYRRSLLIIFTTCLLLFSGGCGAFYGIFIDPLMPPPIIPAEHNMIDKDILIWVDRADSFSNSAQSPLLRRELTLQLQQKLLENLALGSVIDYERIIQYRNTYPNIAQMSIQKLGEKFHAQQVLYVLINDFKLHHEAGQGYYQAEIEGYCKVIDVETGKRLWPIHQTHRPFSEKKPVTTGDGQNFENEQVRNLTKDLASKIATFFYKHKKKK